MEKKEISTRTTIKAIITGFVSYGIIIMFLGIIAYAFIYTFLNKFSGSTAQWLHITIPLILAILIYFIIHGVCKLSTYDVFKKCKTNPENYKTINKYLTLFFILCIILSMMLFLSWLYLDTTYQYQYIQSRILNLRSAPDAYVNKVSTELFNKYNESVLNAVTSTVIVVTAITLSFLSLIVYQEKMIKKYNEV